MFELTVANTVFISLGCCFLLGIPIGYSLGIATTAGLLLTPIPLVYIAQTFFTGTGLFPLIAIPGFILAGDLMIKTEITDKIIKVISILIGRLPGGLGFVTMVACAFFASLSGSGPATTAAIGSIMIPVFTPNWQSLLWVDNIRTVAFFETVRNESSVCSIWEHTPRLSFPPPSGNPENKYSISELSRRLKEKYSE